MHTNPLESDDWRSWPIEARQRLLERLQAQHGDTVGTPETNPDWRGWLTARLPEYVRAGFASRHERLWGWLTALTRGTPPRPCVEIWPRGGAKSSTAELGCAWVHARRARKYVLYVSGTQDQADKHVSAVATILEQLGISRLCDKYGNSKGWRRQELRTADGFNVSAYGLDVAARGIKLDQYRPDLIILDDVDDRHDTDRTVEKKIASITQSILPAGSSDCAVLFIQNLVHRGSIAAQLANGSADFLLDRLPVTVEKAVDGLQYERVPQSDGTMRYRITAGVPTWDGQSLATCQAQLNSWGRLAFTREAQQNVTEAERGLWQLARDIEPFRVTTHPPLLAAGIGLDPTCTTAGDAAGIVGFGVAEVNGMLHGYVLSDRSLHGSPTQWATEAVAGYHALPCTHRTLVAEKNQGGEMITTTIQTVPGAPHVELIAVHDNKRVRAEPVHKLYEEGCIHHVGTFAALEDEQTSWEEGDPSPNRMDALVEIVTKLMLTKKSGDYEVRSFVM